MPGEEEGNVSAAPAATVMSSTDPVTSPTSILASVRCRTCRPTDIPACAAIEAASYPASEAASKSSLQYRQHHCSSYFRCAVIKNKDHAEDDDHATVIGFVCSTKCHAFTHESMSAHDASGKLLAIHSVVVAAEYRRQGIATRMLQDYIQSVLQEESPPEKIVLLAKAHLLAFYVRCGFQVIRPSRIVHGDELWYDLELDVASTVRQKYPQCYTVDAFADPSAAGTGNPAAVVLLEEKADCLWMQTVAQEFNLSETAFVWPKTADSDEEANNRTKNQETHFYIRYFTPTVEVSLCGHATLASASILYQTAKCEADTAIVFHAPSDALRAIAARRPEERSTVISMTFPTKPASTLENGKIAAQNMLASALNIDESSILFMGLSEGLGDILVEVTHDCFSQIGYDRHLNIPAMLEWEGYTRGVIVCCEESPVQPMMTNDGEDSSAPRPVEVDFLSRFFGPKAGIEEDPVTGSAHCALAPYFCTKLSKDSVIGRQVSKRGGIVECEMAKDGASVKLTGTAVTTVSGTLWIDL